MAARGQHKVAHPVCPHASWAACDAAEKVRFGQCKAVVGDREPTPCTRWAVSEEGWCWQHYASEKERIIREAAQAERKLQLMQKIDAYLEKIARMPSVWDGVRMATAEESTVGLAGVAPGLGVEPSRMVLETAPPPRLPGRKPFRITEL